ncbi:uncharacterized protein PHALS_05505 [Plasmopara halstedii]|uniref:Uncharacterized protein n=1 Tax=Plasmopara halstedii TaxID=4781 RepID=A0A0P1B2L3_PLAHL|nr:uncharacterized protein PHALS_05505 [Plasmopara halstedii]CEG48026.1 hypothetical protein PHALS_05505 [Plasmopara halstedii]|eukprot:XP_024584395.1 hypothetical protein PHALS_05505 [Plasmopara halstedii]
MICLPLAPTGGLYIPAISPGVEILKRMTFQSSKKNMEYCYEMYITRNTLLFFEAPALGNLLTLISSRTLCRLRGSDEDVTSVDESESSL